MIDEFYEKITQDLKDEMDDLSQIAFLSLGSEGMKLEFIQEESESYRKYQEEYSNIMKEYERLSKETMVDDLYED